mmetsp:Transcript_5438/g.14727  ORF Transcript_5438/g.14727 Transcript_5438/m.14727 type:complete len:226 (-) Transcript_5438:487-1164(-)
MLLVPVVGDLLAGANPHLATVALGIFHELCQGSNACWARQSAMQTDAHHLGTAGTSFLDEESQRLLQMSAEIRGIRISAAGGNKSHVILSERVRNHEMWTPRCVLHVPVWQIITVGIGIVEETTFLHDEAAGVFIRLALVDADGALAEQVLMDLDGAFDVFTFSLCVDALGIIQPTVSVRRDLPFCFLHGTDCFDVALQGHAHSKDGDGHLFGREEPMEPPKSTS